MDALPPFADPLELTHDVVVVGAFAGGLPALRALVEGLSSDFPLPVLAMLHLPAGAEPEAALQRLPLRAQRLQPGQVLAPGVLWLCPPRVAVELLPNGRCIVADNPAGALARPIDRLFTSIARSFGHRAIGVILTGMGDDGAAGALELHAAGGRVLVQSPGSADHADMPAAAIAAGAADLVVPLHDVGEVVAEFARGAPRTKARSELRAVVAAFGERGDVAAAALDVDWQATPLGAALAWPDPFKRLVRETQDASDASAIWWGAQHVEIYNDAWRGFLGARHPEALGRPARQNWQTREHGWDRLGLLAEQVMSSGRAVAGEPLAWRVRRAGALEEVFASFSCAPLRDLGGQVLGLRCTLWETTRDVVAERRMQLLRALGTAMASAAHRHEACVLAADALAAAPNDIVFALVYLVDGPRRQATLASATGLPAGSAAAPRVAHLSDTASGAGQWPLERALPGPLAAAPPVLVDDVGDRFPELAAAQAAHAEAPCRAALLPLHTAARGEPQGVAVVGLPPHRPLDAAHVRFLELLGQQMTAGLGDARAKELERERGDRLSALDHARTGFFSNVSHEFRTPLTLLLAPLEELAREREALPRRVVVNLDVAVRNARRLLRLVNSLLDFSQVEERSRQAAVAPADLGMLTADIASAFRSAIEAAGLALQVDVPPDLPPVPVNAAMWEQIVSNLLSNALKFTFEGAIAVRLKALHLHVELEVADTGIGISADDLPNIFKRFHRVQGARARTSEGSGIGLAMVQDLVQRLGGQLSARSVAGQGSTFTIWLPLKSHRLLAEPTADAAGQPHLAVDLAGEASRWSAGTPPDAVLEDMLEPPPLAGEGGDASLPRLLVADDNADLRDYLRRLLGRHWHVQLAANGAQALALAQQHPPYLVLADVMMPELDGFALLQRLRELPRLATVPVILLTARASEEAAIEGLRAGADDYIAKPFSPRELLARLQATLGRARAEAALRDSEAKFRATFETMIEACCIFDMVYDEQGRPVDWKILEANPGYERQSGLKGVAGRLASDVMPGTEPYWIETFARIVETGEAEQIEKWHQPTGRWIHSSTARVGGPGSRRLVSVFYDITERKQAEIALRESEARFRNVLNAMAEGFALFAPDFTILDVNDETCRVDGRGRGELVGRSHWDAFPGTEQSPLGEFYRRVMSDRVAGALEYRYLWPDGRDMWVDVRAYPTPEGHLAVFWRDSTERKRAEARIRDSELKYRTLFEAIDEGFVTAELIFDADGRAVDALYLEGNPAASRLTDGRNYDNQLLSAVVPGAEAYWLEIYAEVARTGVAQRLERHLQTLQCDYSFHISRLPLPDAQGRHRRVAIVFREC